MPNQRRLAAVLIADVAGYSRLIGTDEERTLDTLATIRSSIVDPAVAAHHGRVVRITGDGLLIEFGSVVEAVRCAIELQQQVASHNASRPAPERIEYRIGVNFGEIVIGDDGDIAGDGVNIAARLEALADAGGICVSARVQEEVAARLGLAFEDMGEQSLKNIARQVRAYRLRREAAGPSVAPASRGEPTFALPDKPSIAVLAFPNMSNDAEQAQRAQKREDRWAGRAIAS